MKSATKNLLKVRRAPVIESELTVPGDKSISHRAILLSSISNGRCTITNFLEGEDCRSTAKAMQQLGVVIETPEPGTVIVEGNRGIFKAPSEDIDCGNSGTTMRLMSGLLAAQAFRTRLTGDPSLSQRPMRRVMSPLQEMGAHLSAEGVKQCPPMVVEGGPLTGISYRLPVASAQVKSAVLLAGLFAKGSTTVIETTRSRDHTERMLEYFLVRLKREDLWEGSSPADRKLKESRITLEGGQIPESRDFKVPGDISSAAFWLVAAAAQSGSRLLVKDVGLNPTRTGILDVLIRMGARIREVVESSENGEPAGTIDIKGCKLHGTEICGAEIPNVIDEIPAIAVAAALASGTTMIRDAGELRVKETDRIAAVATNLRAMGVAVEEFPDGMSITGGKPLKGAKLQSFGDHRIAMAFAIAGLFASGETVIEDTACVQTSYPGFAETLRLIQKGKGVGRRTPVISSLGSRSRRRKAMSVVAIDGPAASGKSSVSRRLAKRLGFAYVNSGSMYRAVTWEVLRQGVDTANAASVAEALIHADIVCGISETNESFIRINSTIPDAALRDSRVNLHVSLVSAVPAVRELISSRLRALAEGRNVVMEGRDIGSAVFPETPFKFYLDACPEVRRQRRAAEGGSDEIEARDKMDSSRKAAPLRIAGDARVLDTSDLTLEGVVDALLDLLRPLGITSR